MLPKDWQIDSVEFGANLDLAAKIEEARVEAARDSGEDLFYPGARQRRVLQYEVLLFTPDFERTTLGVLLQQGVPEKVHPARNLFVVMAVEADDEAQIRHPGGSRKQSRIIHFFVTLRSARGPFKPKDPGAQLLSGMVSVSSVRL